MKEAETQSVASSGGFLLPYFEQQRRQCSRHKSEMLAVLRYCAILVCMGFLLLSFYTYLLPVSAIFHFNPPLDQRVVFKGESYNPHHGKYVMLQAIFDFAEKNDIDMQLTEGGLLGVARGRSLLPWDHDVDISVKPDHFKKVLQLECEWEALGFEARVDEGHTGLISGFRLHAKGYHYPEFELNKFETTKGCSFNEVGFRSLNREECARNREDADAKYPERQPMQLKDTHFGYEASIYIPKDLDKLVWEKYGESAKTQCKPDIRKCSIQECVTSYSSLLFDIFVGSYSCAQVHQDLESYDRSPSSPVHILIIILMFLAIGWNAPDDKTRLRLGLIILLVFGVAVL